MPPTEATSLKIVIDHGSFSAYLRPRGDDDLNALTANAILDSLSAVDVVLTEAVRSRVEVFCQEAQTNPQCGKEFLMAEGTPVKPPVDARWEMGDDLKRKSDTPPESDEEADGTPIDYYAQCRLLTINDGEKIGVIEPAQPPVDGVDLLGEPIPSPGEAVDLKVGDGVRLDSDGKTVYAARSGLVRTKGDTLWVDDVVTIAGDVDLESGAVDAPCDVVVKGTVRDLFNVKTVKSLSVGGAIENNHVEADGDVVVRGGIAGKGKGSVTAGGQIICKFCDASTLRAQGDITITKEAINADVRTMGRLLLPRGAAIGGTYYARGGGEMKEIGSDAEVRTRLTIGLDPVLLAKASRTESKVAKQMEAAKKIRAAVGPLIANIKRLAPDQRERATELMFQADRLQSDAEDLLAESAKMIEEGRWDEEPVLIVLDRINPGTTLIFEDFEFICREVLKGPIRIFKRRAGEGVASGLISINTLSGSRRELFCRKYEATIPDEPCETDAEQTDPDQK